MSMRPISPLLLSLLSGCFLTTAQLPSKLAIQQLEAAKKLNPQSVDYNKLISVQVDCPTRPATDRQRDMSCAQLWAYKASGCLKAQQDYTSAIAGRVVISADEREAPSRALDCALAASESAVAFLPSTPLGQNGENALKILILRARTIELRRARRDTREAVIDDAEIGAVAMQMTPLPNGPLPDGSPSEGSYYASYFLAGTAARNATKAALAAQSGPDEQRNVEKSRACSAAQGGLQVLPKTVKSPSLDAPLTTRRNLLTRLTTEFCA